MVAMARLGHQPIHIGLAEGDFTCQKGVQDFH